MRRPNYFWHTVINIFELCLSFLVVSYGVFVITVFSVILLNYGLTGFDYLTETTKNLLWVALAMAALMVSVRKYYNLFALDDFREVIIWLIVSIVMFPVMTGYWPALFDTDELPAYYTPFANGICNCSSVASIVMSAYFLFDCFIEMKNRKV